MRFLFIPALCCMALLSCNEKMDDGITMEPSDYYALSVGKYVIYDVDSTVYNETIDDAVSHWQIMEAIVDTFYDLGNELNYRIERSRRAADTLDWQLMDIWSVKVHNGAIERDENNLRFIKLASPIAQDKTWDGTIYLGDLDSLPYERACDKLSFLENWEYMYTGINGTETYNGMSYDSVVTVMQQGADNLLELNYCMEHYAKGIGMIAKEFYHYTSQNTANIPWEDKVECGYEYSMSIVEHN